MQFAKIPNTINYNNLVNHKNKSFSSSDYLSIKINCHYEYLENLILEPIYGKEIGSFNYIDKSKIKFIRTKCLQNTSILLNMKEQININPKSFRNFNLLKGDILLVKDSNIGEICYLDEDLPNHSISSGIVKINFNKKIDNFYLIGILKSSFFKEQIDLMTPKGATIRHSKDNFKYTKIPIPSDKKIIKKISILTQSLISKEIELKNKFNKINDIITNELNNNQKNKKYSYSMPTYQDIKEHNRLDTGLYTKEFKTIEFLIKNYTNGFYYLDAKDLKSGSTPKENERIFNFGDINWITPTNMADTGIMNTIPKIAIKNKKYNITKDCILFINRTSKGTKGEHVGISFFYDYNKLGKGQHNQGLYRLDNKSKDELLYLSSYINSELARKLCSNISMGSKMKEMKSMDFEKLPIPSFGIDIQQQLAKLYYNQNDDYLKHIEKFNITSFNKIDLEVNRNSGILDLNLQIQIIKSIIKNNINEMIK